MLRYFCVHNNKYSHITKFRKVIWHKWIKVQGKEPGTQPELRLGTRKKYSALNFKVNHRVREQHLGKYFTTSREYLRKSKA
jgi:hypothetical protein